MSIKSHGQLGLNADMVDFRHASEFMTKSAGWTGALYDRYGTKFFVVNGQIVSIDTPVSSRNVMAFPIGGIPKGAFPMGAFPVGTSIYDQHDALSGRDLFASNHPQYAYDEVDGGAFA